MRERSARTVVAAAAAALVVAVAWLPGPATARSDEDPLTLPTAPPRPPVTLPPISIQLGPIGIDVAPITLLPGAPTTTAAAVAPPATSPAPAADPSVDDATRGAVVDHGGDGAGADRGAVPPPTVATTAPPSGTGAGPVTESTPVSAAGAVRQVADTFRFPLGLGLAIVVFLLVQGQFDRRDRRLASITLDRREEYVSFR